MFDIDKYLDDINIKEMNPDDELIKRTKRRCEEEAIKAKEKEENRKGLKNSSVIIWPVAAAALILIVLGTLFIVQTGFAPQEVAYYTVDINPSICVNVDSNNKVTGLVSQNADAAPIVGGLDVVGKPASEAIDAILGAAQTAGYLGDGKYVLIGCFASDGSPVKGSIGDLQATLEAHFGDMINLLIVQGNIDDFQQAGKLKVSAGLLKLAELAHNVQVGSGDKVEDVYTKVQCENSTSYQAPHLSADAGAGKLNFSWDALDFNAMGYVGTVKYKLAAGDTKDEVMGLSAHPYRTVSFNASGNQVLSCTLSPSDGISAGAYKYYAIYAQYGDVTICSNVVYVGMPQEAAPTPTPTQNDTPPSQTDKPDPTVTPPPADSHTVMGKVSDGKVVLSWSRDTTGNLAGYKVVASKSNPNPKYPDDGYLKFITTPETTSISLSAGSYGLDGGTYYYFSITYLYNDGSTIAGNAVKLKVPEKSETTTPPPSDGYPSSTISGSLDGDTIHLHWSEIDDGRFSYYKVVYSFSDHTPVYGGSGSHLYYYSSDPDDTSCDVCISDLTGRSPGATCYFSVTVLYSGESGKKAGNTISIKLPGETEPEDPYPTTNIHASLNDDNTRVNFSWGGVTDDRFVYYKVVGSHTDHSPSYNGGDYLECKSAGETSWSMSVSSLISKLGGGPGETYYFAITCVYDGNVYKTGSVDTITLPAAPPEPEHKATTVSGGLDGNTVNLSWDAITGDEWFMGFKVMYRFEGADTHSYGSETTDTNCSLNITSLTGYTPGASCSFWIKTYYDGGVYKSSNSISVTAP